MIYDTIIIGAGISGLGCAYYHSKQGEAVLVLEKETHVGGLCHSAYLNQQKEFWLEMGAHTLYNSYEYVIEIIEALNLQNQLVKRQKLPFRIYHQGYLHSLFRYLNPISFSYGMMQLPFKNKTNQSVESFYGKLFGRGNYKRVLKDCFSAVLSQNADEFPAEFLFNKKKRNKDYPRSFSLINGISSLFDELITHKRFITKLNHAVIEINKNNKYWQVLTNQGVFDAKHVIIATDVRTAGNLAFSVMPKLSERLNEIKLSSIDSVGVMFHRKDLLHFKELAGLIGKGDSPFYSMISRDVIPDSNYRGFVFHFKKDALKPIGEHLAYICQLLEVNQSAIVRSFSKENQIPILTVEHKMRLQQIAQLLQGSSLALTGNYFRRLALEDCLAHSAQLKLG
ncbi:FAD-dependent oxidoreductase [Thiotrichales bacterium 19S3-7]|nr:FAD-dependent oxidoreductase [Thiotrichales bacterium 19S3-7]MCF6801711.1 FAD-dependent oxidoreductase [Thiotrichales bacterium 19S3-11]